jgi:hypothetical protein
LKLLGVFAEAFVAFIRLWWLSYRRTKMAYLAIGVRGLTLALAAAGALSLSVTADAAVYKGKWDPPFGSPLLDLGWSGEAEFEIKSACLDNVSDDGWVSNSGSCAGLVTINSATVTLYDLVAGQNGPADDVTLSYGASQSPVTLRMYVDVEGGKKMVTAVEGSYFAPLVTTASFAKLATATEAQYFLSFNGNVSNSPGGAYTPDKAYSFLKSCNFSGQQYLGCSNNDSGQYPAVMTIVPEPQGYLLGLASLAVVGMWSRRRLPVGA